MSKGRAAAYKQTHARILLLCDENQADGAMKDEEIARALKLGTATVERVRRRGVEEGLEAALGRRQQLNPSEETGRCRRGSPVTLLTRSPSLRRAANSMNPATAGGPTLRSYS